MNVELYDKDWSESRTESFREVVIETAIERVRVVEICGTLNVVRESDRIVRRGPLETRADLR